MGTYFFFSIGGIFITSVDPPCPESTDHGLNITLFSSPRRLLKDNKEVEAHQDAAKQLIQEVKEFKGKEKAHEREIKNMENQKEAINGSLPEDEELFSDLTQQTEEAIKVKGIIKKKLLVVKLVNINIRCC